MSTDVLETHSGVETKARKGRTILRATLRILRASKTAILALALLASLALNVAAVTVAPVFNALSSAVGAIAGNLATVQGRHVQERLTIKKAVRQTTRRISGRVARATARSTGSIAAESIPYVGVGVILGVTAWEIRDACDTMEDLHRLELALDPEAEQDRQHAEVCGMTVPTRDEILVALRESPARAWEKAATWASGLPSWEDARGTTQDAWQEVLGWLKTTLTR